MSGERQDTEQENPEAGLPTEQCSRGELCRRIDLLTITVTELSRRAAEAGDRAKALLDQKFNLVVAPPPDPKWAKLKLFLQNLLDANSTTGGYNERAEILMDVIAKMAKLEGEEKKTKRVPRLVNGPACPRELEVEPHD